MANKSKNTITAYDDSQWRAESDCHTLIEAEKIKADPARLKAAKAAAKKKMKEMQQTMGSMQTLSNSK